MKRFIIAAVISVAAFFATTAPAFGAPADCESIAQSGFNACMKHGGSTGQCNEVYAAVYFACIAGV
jgi:hypothetical protein